MFKISSTYIFCLGVDHHLHVYIIIHGMGLFKTVMIGDQDVGKSSLFVRFRDDRFVEILRSTIGLDNTKKSLTFTDDEGNEKSGTVSFCS